MGIVSKEVWEPITPEQRDALRAAWPDVTRLTTAWRIARDVDALEDLLAGRAVAPTRLRMEEVARARRRDHVLLVSSLEASGLEPHITKEESTS